MGKLSNSEVETMNNIKRYTVRIEEEIDGVNVCNIAYGQFHYHTNSEQWGVLIKNGHLENDNFEDNWKDDYRRRALSDVIAFLEEIKKSLENVCAGKRKR